MWTAIGPLGLQGNETSGERVLDHDGRLPRRVALGVRLLMIAGHWDGPIRSNRGDVVEEDRVGSDLEIVPTIAANIDEEHGLTRRYLETFPNVRF